MSIQNRVSVTLSPRMRKALELAAGLDGTTTAAYATQLLSAAIKNELKESPILNEKWLELEKEALRNKSWDTVVLPMMANSDGLQEDYLLPKGWFLSGDNPDGYTVGQDPKQAYKGDVSGFIRSKSPSVRGFGTLMQQTSIAERHVGKQLQFSAVVKTENVKSWSGVWVRVDGPDAQVLWFDNMQDRPIKGTTDWKEYQINFDVPEKSKALSFGVLLVGPGSVWINDVRLAEVQGKNKKTLKDLDTSLTF